MLEVTGAPPRARALPAHRRGLIAFLTLGLDGPSTLARRARARERDRGARPQRASRDRRGDRPHRAGAGAATSVSRCGSACSAPRRWSSSAAGRAGSRATASSSSPPRRCRRSSPAAAWRASTPSIPWPSATCARRCSSRRACASSPPFEPEAGRYFSFASPYPVLGPESELVYPADEPASSSTGPAVAAVIGAEGEIAGFTPPIAGPPATSPAASAEQGARPAKSSDFGLSLGPLLLTGAELERGRLLARVNGEERTSLDLRDLGSRWEDAARLRCRRHQTANGRPADRAGAAARRAPLWSPATSSRSSSPGWGC